MLPSTFASTEYWFGAAENTAVSQFLVEREHHHVGDRVRRRAVTASTQVRGRAHRAPVRSDEPAVTTADPGSTSPAKTACCSVIPVVPGPKFPVIAWPSIRSVLPISAPVPSEFARTLIRDVQRRSPSMMSSAPRP